MITDLTDRFNTSRYQRDGVIWQLSRANEPVEAIVVHHTAGFYGISRRAAAVGLNREMEEEQVRRLAVDHYTRFGIGPGYHYAVFPTGRAYAIGKAGTHRAHTKGRNPLTLGYWNRSAIGIVAFGEYEKDTPPPVMLTAIGEIIREIEFWTGNPAMPVYAHRHVPTVNSSGTVYTQGTLCCGRNLIAKLPFIIGTGGSMPEPEPERKIDVAEVQDLLDALVLDTTYTVSRIREVLGID